MDGLEEEMSYYLRDIIELRKDFAEAYTSKKYADAIVDFMTRHFVLKNQAAFQSSPLS